MHPDLAAAQWRTDGEEVADGGGALEADANFTSVAVDGGGALEASARVWRRCSGGPAGRRRWTEDRRGGGGALEAEADADARGGGLLARSLQEKKRIGAGSLRRG